VPFGYHFDEQSRKGLIVGGAVTFGTMYSLTAGLGLVGMAFGGTGQGAEIFLIPLAGPFIATQTAGNTPASTALLVADGLLQVGGVAMLVAGIVARETVLVRNDVARGFLMPTPMTFGPNSGGIGLVGTF
jgi:hypothetical protein